VNARSPETPTIAPIVALDIGNVCVCLQPEQCAQAFGFADMREMAGRHPGLWQAAAELETGQIDDAAFFARVAAAVGNSMTIAQAQAAWKMLIGPEMHGMAALVEELLARNLQLVFFSDISTTHLQLVRRRLSFAEAVKNAIVSYKVGACKPDARMYEAMEQQFCGGGVPCLYLDDKPENINAARQRGWQAHVFTDTATARSFVAEGLRTC